MKFKKIMAVFSVSAAILLPVSNTGGSYGLYGFADNEEEMYEEYMDEYNEMADNFYDDVYEYYVDDIEEAEYADEGYNYDNSADSYESSAVERSNTQKSFNPILAFFISLIIGLLIAFIAVGSMKSKLKTVRSKTDASDYTKPESMKMKFSNDVFLYKKLDKMPIARQNQAPPTNPPNVRR